MNWADFVSLIEAPAFVGLILALAWIYRDLCDQVRRLQVDIQAETMQLRQETEHLRKQHQHWLIDVIRDYVPKEDVARLEARILAAISRVEAKIDGQRTGLI